MDKKDESVIRTFLSQVECDKYFGVSGSTISNRLKKYLTFNHDEKLVFLCKRK